MSNSKPIPVPARDEYQLPTTTIPVNYNVALVPDFDKFTFQGHVIITIKVKQSTNTIVLNSNELSYLEDEQEKPRITITKLNNDNTTANSVQASSVELDAKAERVRIKFDTNFDANAEYNLSIHYTGILNDQLCGFYRSKYTNPKTGKDSMIAVTQFEATDCRRAIPSYDEPALKASFDATLIVPAKYTALSNMNVIRKTATKSSCSDEEKALNRGLQYSDECYRYEFARTPIMSTYLLAFVVAELEYLSGYTHNKKTNNKVQVSVYTPIGKVHLAKFALDTAIASIEFFENYFNIDYKLPKADLVAIPDFALGAMENWGLVTYREVAVLIDELNSSAMVKTRAARTIAHECSHFWFGNLCTMDWWTNLWLNEGFARFTEHLAVDAIFPDWAIWTQFVSDVHGSALGLDSLESSHPVEVPVYHSSEVNEIFDMISYAKGGSVIRMLYSYLGDDMWRTALNHYLTKFAYSNAVTNDLWQCLSEKSSVDVCALMDKWIKVTGYPVVSVEEIASDNNNKRKFKLSQQRFYANMQGRVKNSDEYWAIPLTVTTADGKHTDKVIFDKSEGVVELSLPAGVPLKFNVNQAGFYRVYYSNELLQQLLPVVDRLSPSDRLGIQRDIFALSSSGMIEMSGALDLLLRFKGENNFSVIQAFSGNVSALASLHRDESYYPALQKFIGDLYAQMFKSYGWENTADTKDTYTAGLIRATILPLLGLSGDQAVQSEAVQRLQKFLDNPTKNSNLIAGDLRGAVYSIAMKADNNLKIRDDLIKFYENSDSAEEKCRILGALGSVSGKGANDKQIILDNLKYGFSDKVRSSETFYLINSNCSSSLGRELTWEYLKSNWSDFTAKYNAGQNFMISNILSGPLNGVNSASAADEFESFFASHPLPSAQRVIKQAAENVRQKDARLNRERSQLEKWLKEKGY